MPGNIVGIVFIGIWLLAFAAIVIKWIKNRYAPVKSVNAVVLDKQIIESFSKYAGNGKQKKYVVVFLANNKKLSFYVSSFSYGRYKVGEKGMLKYKGSRLIDFS